MRILVTGASGLLGNKVIKLALKRGHEVYSIYKEHPISIGKSIKLDITSYRELHDVISRIKPDVIIHTAAYTDVDGCEMNKDLAWKVNAEATKHIAIISAKVSSYLIYISTDYVFDGSKGLYSEEDIPNPISYYGYTKLKGEEFVREYAKEWCIARTSVIYGWGLHHKMNFATWLISNLKQGKEVKVLIDQYVSPTLNINLAQMILEMAERRLSGILHTAGRTRVSRFMFALSLAETFGLNVSLIKPAKMEEMNWKAKRPKDSSLNVNKAISMLKTKPLELHEALKAMRRDNHESWDFHT